MDKTFTEEEKAILRDALFNEIEFRRRAPGRMREVDGRQPTAEERKSMLKRVTDAIALRKKVIQSLTS